MAVLMAVIAALVVVEMSMPAKHAPGETLPNYSLCVRFVLGGEALCAMLYLPC